MSDPSTIRGPTAPGLIQQALRAAGEGNSARGLDLHRPPHGERPQATGRRTRTATGDGHPVKGPQKKMGASPMVGGREFTVFGFNHAPIKEVHQLHR